MKIRLDFVTNSSSSSFVAFGVYDEKLAKLVEEKLKRFKPYPNTTLGAIVVHNGVVTVTRELCDVDGGAYFIDSQMREEEDGRTAWQRSTDKKKALTAQNAVKAFRDFFDSDFLSETTKELIGNAVDDDCAICEVFVDQRDGFETKDFSYECPKKVPSSKIEAQLAVPSGTTEIKRNAFHQNLTFEHVVVPEGVTKIGASAFSGCKRLKTIEIPSTVREIGTCAFLNCESLKEIVLPGSIKVIPSKTFKGCSALKRVTVSEGTLEIGEEAFFECEALTDVTFPSTLREIGKNAFNGCKRLKTLDLPSGLESIKPFAFGGCQSLQEAVLPPTLKELCCGAFADCKSIKTVVLPATLEQLGDRAFCDCYALESITIPNGVKGIGAHAFAQTSLVSVFIPASVERIGVGALDCLNLESISVDENNAFYIVKDNVLFKKDRKTLVKYPAKKAGAVYDVPYGVTVIGYGAFKDANMLKQVAIPNSVNNIDNYAFCNCSSLNEMIIPNGVSEVGYYAFCNCTSLRDIVIPKSVKTIDSYAFCKCKSLKNICLSGSLREIGGWAFCECSSLTEMIIPECVKAIGYGAFKNCTSLKTVILSDSLTELSNAFEGCYNIERFAMSEQSINYVEIDGVVFAKKKSVLVLYPSSKKETEYQIPYGTKEIGKHAFSMCQNLESLSIPEGVTKIGSYAFAGARQLKSIRFPSTLSSVGEYAFDSLVSDDYYNYGTNTTTTECVFYLPPNAGRSLWDLLKKYRQPMRYAPRPEMRAVDPIAPKPYVKWSEVCDDVTIEYKDKIFVLTGFDEKEEKKLTDLIVANGGLVKSSVVLATNYLVVNLNYKGAATTKYKRAIELNGKGKNILIVAGSDIFASTLPKPYIKWSKVRDNVDVEFQGKIFVLTGFDSVTEKEGTSFIIRNGGIVKNSVSLDVDYLVVNRFYAGEETSEYKRALELNKARSNIRIISYERLLNSIEHKSAATWSAICDSVVVEYKGKNFVFTGFDHSTVEALSSLVFRRGGDVKGSLSPDTDYLIVNSYYTGEETVSYKRALELNKNGKNIRIISDKKLHASLSAKK